MAKTIEGNLDQARILIRGNKWDPDPAEILGYESLPITVYIYWRNMSVLSRVTRIGIFCAKTLVLKNKIYIVCSRSLDPFHIVSYTNYNGSRLLGHTVKEICRHKF